MNACDDALAEVCRRHRTELVRLLVSRKCEPEDAEDFVQEAMIRMLLHLRRHGLRNREPLSLVALFNRAAASSRVDGLRKMRSLRSLREKVGERIAAKNPAFAPPREHADGEILDAVCRAVLACPDRPGTALRMILFEGRSVPFTARALGVSQVAVYDYVGRGLGIVRNRLRAEGLDPGRTRGAGGGRKSVSVVRLRRLFAAMVPAGKKNGAERK